MISTWPESSIYHAHERPHQMISPRLIISRAFKVSNDVSHRVGSLSQLATVLHTREDETGNNCIIAEKEVERTVFTRKERKKINEHAESSSYVFISQPLLSGTRNGPGMCPDPRVRGSIVRRTKSRDTSVCFGS
jgi:hypothetical protein